MMTGGCAPKPASANLARIPSCAVSQGTLEVPARAVSNSMSEKMTSAMRLTCAAESCSSTALASSCAKSASMSVFMPQGIPRTKRTISPRSGSVSAGSSPAPSCTSLSIGMSTRRGWEWNVKSLPRHGLSVWDCARRRESATATSMGSPLIEPETSHTGTIQPRSPCARASTHPRTRDCQSSFSSNAARSAVADGLPADVKRAKARLVTSWGRMEVEWRVAASVKNLVYLSRSCLPKSEAPYSSLHRLGMRA
mmetsp:Transcript_40575/g.95286  ORF Transcript_40575/g.95286 Transcript_40575/m.95286 type:complete len:252 (-) Transcript_40575:1261-2016(-)